MITFYILNKFCIHLIDNGGKIEEYKKRFTCSYSDSFKFKSGLIFILNSFTVV